MRPPFVSFQKQFSVAQATALSARRSLTGEMVLAIVLALALTSFVFLAPLLTTHDPMQGNLMARFKPPGTENHWLGTDELGRDIWSRTLAGFKWSLSAAFMASVIAMSVGTALGLIAAQRAGIIRTLIRQSVDIVLSFPGLIVAICVITLWGQGFWQLVLTLGLLSWPVFTRVVYAEALSLLERDYVSAATLMGVPRTAILLRHVLPGLRASLMVVMAFHFADMLIAESALSFLGIGAPLGEPTWGNMLAASRDKLIQAPWMMLAPACAIVLAVVTANLAGDGLARASRQQGKEVVIA